jgi:hypothetical protein
VKCKAKRVIGKKKTRSKRNEERYRKEIRKRQG